MGEAQASGRDDLADLRERVSQLEQRMALVERGGVIAPPTVTPAARRAARSQIDTDLTVATVFTRVAMLSFVLLGALILRVLTQEHILGAGFGTLLGFVYAGHLIVLTFLPGRPGQFARATNLFQCCGVLLSFFIALESSLRSHTLARPTAMVLMGGFALLALGVAMAYRKASLAGTAIVGGMLALVALGLDPEGLPLQVSLLVALAAAAAALSWRYAWGFLRPLTFPLLMLLLSVGCLLAGKESLGGGALYAGATAFGLVLVLQHTVAFRKLGVAAAWLPAAVGWLAALAGAGAWPALATVAVTVSALATLVTVAVVRAGPAVTAGVTGLAATAVIAGAVGWPMIDPSGVLCALAGVALWAAARRSQPNPWWGAGSALILMMVATARGVFQLVHAGPSLHALCTGGLLAGILLVHFLLTDRARMGDPAGLDQGVAAPVLAAGLLVLFAVLRGIAHRLFSDPSALQLTQTGILSAAAVLLTLGGHVGHRRAVMYAGLACMAASLLKVGLIDLSRLTGFPLLTSIVLLGLSSVGVSVSLRRRD